MRMRTVLPPVLLGTCLALPLSALLAWDQSRARIITQTANPAECLSRVAIRKIDGEEKFVHPQGFTIEPGRHTMSGTVALDTSYCKVARGNEWTQIPPLEADFEAGKTYYVGFDHSSTNRNDWRLVVWKVE